MPAQPLLDLLTCYRPEIPISRTAIFIIAN